MMRRVLLDKVYSFTCDKSLFLAPCHVLAGVSGGADSMTLLDVLLHWPAAGLRVSVVHVHHGLRGEAADRDEAFVRDYCDKYSLPLTVIRADVASVARERGCSIEEAGRQVRYEHFESVRAAIGADYVLTAHTASDQVETVLMHLMRGCGVDGLAGIPDVRGHIRRPLLCCDRQEIEEYCAINSIPFVTDETNVDTTYTRNAVRHQVLPTLRQINPSVDEAVLRLSKCAMEDASYLNTLAVSALHTANCDGGYRAQVFAEQDSVIRRRMIRLLLRDSGVPTIGESHILAAEKVVLSGHGSVDLPGVFVFSVQQGVVSVRMTDVFTDEWTSIAIGALPCKVTFFGKEYDLSMVDNGDLNVHKLFLNCAIDYDRIQGDLCLRSRQSGDYLHADGRGVGKSLKKWMNEWHVPTHLRDAYLVLCDSVGVILVPGYACDERVRVTDDTKHLLVCKVVAEQG